MNADRVAPALLEGTHMLARHTLRLGLVVVALFGLAGCSESHTGTTPDGSLMPLLPVDAGTDAPFITFPADVGPMPHDSSITPTACTGLGPAACLAAGCAADFDDVCCSLCAPGACADCTNITYESCQPLDLACFGESCGVAPPWVCESSVPSCESAGVVDFDSCTRVGCVPAYPSGEGEPQTALAVCVPIVAESCTVACRSLPPPCPSGTTAEGDGFCYTGLCIPSFVCL